MLNRFRLILIQFFIWTLIFNTLFVSDLHSYMRRRGHQGIKKTGDLGQYIVPAAAACVAGARSDYKGLQYYASSFGAIMGLSYLIKPTINAERPNGGSMSFPSGHTAAAMGGAAFLHMRYGWAYALPSYLLASYVGFSRVYAYKHWFRDVLGATAIAMAANAFFTKPYADSKYYLIPVLEPHRAGLVVRWQW